MAHLLLTYAVRMENLGMHMTVETTNENPGSRIGRGAMERTKEKRDMLREDGSRDHANQPDGRGRRKKRGGGDMKVLELLQRRDPEGLKLVMDKYHEKLFAVANRICNNPADAEEVLQDVYMIALDKIDRFEQRSTLSTWLYRITVNAALMKLRSLRSSKVTVSMEGANLMYAEEENFLRSDGESRSPDETLMSKEFLQQVSVSLETLPGIYQDVFLLRDVQGYSIKETSEMLDTTPAAIKSRLHRSRAFMQEKLRGYAGRS